MMERAYVSEGTSLFLMVRASNFEGMDSIVVSLDYYYYYLGPERTLHDTFRGD